MTDRRDHPRPDEARHSDERPSDDDRPAQDVHGDDRRRAVHPIDPETPVALYGRCPEWCHGGIDGGRTDDVHDDSGWHRGLMYGPGSAVYLGLARRALSGTFRAEKVWRWGQTDHVELMFDHEGASDGPVNEDVFRYRITVPEARSVAAALVRLADISEGLAPVLDGHGADTAEGRAEPREPAATVRSPDQRSGVEVMRAEIPEPAVLLLPPEGRPILVLRADLASTLLTDTLRDLLAHVPAPRSP